jgi:ankyrin repeat protein
MTPLQWAAYVGRMDEFFELLLRGAGSLATASSNRSVTHHTVEGDCPEILSYLLENGY